jgi:hypothetical protein
VIIQNGQRMTRRSVIGSEPTLEVDLPELIGRFMFEPAQRLMFQGF